MRLLFAVRDTGICIPQDKPERLFDRFEQGEADTTRKYEGTGLGLTIVGCRTGHPNRIENPVPIITMKAPARPGEREKCLNYVMNDYISKSIYERKSQNLLKKYLWKNVHQSNR